MTKQKQQKPEFRARAALEALKGEQTITEPDSLLKFHPTMIHQWKKALIDEASKILSGGRNPTELEV